MVLLIKEKFFAWACMCLALLLAGCTAQYIRDDAQSQLKAGKYEKALSTLEDGLRRYPDSPVLRAGQANVREAVFVQLMAAAASARAVGNDQVAEQALQRAVAINPNDERAKAMLLDIARDRRQKNVVLEAKEFIAKGQLERAMVLIEAGLKDYPKNADLLALQRQQELESKRQELTTTRLAETRPIALDFREANLRMVLEVLTRNSGVNFVLDKDVRQDLRTTIYLQKTRFEDALELITTTNQLAYKVLDPGTVMIYPKTPEKMKEYQDLVIRAFYLSSAEAKQTATLLKTMLKIREPFVDEKLNLIVVRETPETIRLAERLIALHDMSEPEVMMEVEVLEIKSSRLTELGIKFPENFSLTPTPPAGGFNLGNIGQVSRDTIAIGLPSVLLNLRRDVSDAKILANPKIRARNREKAKIMIGDKLPVVTTTSTGGTSGFVAESVQYLDVGLKLEVEPNIYLDDDVAIKVGLEVSSLVASVKTPSGSLVYQIGNRSASTVLRLRDGETQILAGLINNEERLSSSRLPGAGDLPLVGRLFSSNKDDGQRTEIVLSITPHIIRNIRRPDLNQTEFWSGTENNVQSRALTVPVTEKKNGTGNQPAVINDASNPNLTPAMPAAPDAAVVPGILGPLGASAPPSISLKLVAPPEVKLGETFTIQVNMKTDALIRGLPLHLAFDHKALQILSAEEGAFFKQEGVAVTVSKNLEQDAGHAYVGVLRNVAEGAKGEDTVMTLKFKALNVGPSEIRVTSVTPVASRPVPVPELPKTTIVVVK